MTDIEREFMLKLPGWKPNRDTGGMAGSAPLATVPRTDTSQGERGPDGSDNPSTGPSSWTGLTAHAGVDSDGVDRRSLISAMTRIQEYHGTSSPDTIVRQAERSMIRARNDADQLRRLQRVLGV